MAVRKWKGLTERKFLYTLLTGIIFGYLFGYFVLTRLNVFKRNNNGELLFAHFNAEIGESIVNYSADTRGSYEEKTRDFRNGAQDVKLLCWMMTSPSNHRKRAIHAKATWGQRCDHLLLMSSYSDLEFPVIQLPVGEGRDKLWGKTKEAFKYVYENYYNEADWFLKADDDTYIIIENLKYLLASHNSSEALYFGWRFQHLIKQGFMSGGAGYVLSKSALKKFILDGLPNATLCRPDDGGDEDTELGKCMENIGVKALNSRDSFGRERFFPMIPVSNMYPGHSPTDFWYFTFSYYTQKEGKECCSDSAISFHYVKPNMMYVIDCFVYKIKPYGIDRRMYTVE